MQSKAFCADNSLTIEMSALRLPDRECADAGEVLEYKLIYSEFSRPRIQSTCQWTGSRRKMDIVAHSELFSWRDLRVHWRVLLVMPGRSGAKVNWLAERQLIIDLADTRLFFMP